MGVNSFNVGRDGAQVTIFDSSVGQVTINGITSFESKPGMIKLKSVGINGRISHRPIPDGHSGTFEIDRQDASFDAYFADAEASYYAQLPPTAVIITQTINELDGSVSQFQFIDVALYPEDSGTYKGQDKVTQRFTFDAGTRIRIS